MDDKSTIFNITRIKDYLGKIIPELSYELNISFVSIENTLEQENSSILTSCEFTNFNGILEKYVESIKNDINVHYTSTSHNCGNSSYANIPLDNFADILEKNKEIDLIVASSEEIKDSKLLLENKRYIFLFIATIESKKYYNIMEDAYYIPYVLHAGRKIISRQYPMVNNYIAGLFSYLMNDCKQISSLNHFAFNLCCSDSSDWILRYCLYGTFQDELPEPELLTYLSSLTYESSLCHSVLLFIKKEDIGNISKCSTSIVFEHSDYCITAENGRQIRKLMETAGDGYVLVIAKTDPFIIHSIANADELRFKDTFSVVFDGHMKWTLNCNNQVILSYKDGVYKFPFQSKKSKLNTEIDKIFISQNDKTEIITDIIKSAALQKHGTLIIISDNANSEAIRLCKVRRGFKIEPLALYKQRTVIEKISSIDGALLIDFNGICYAIGVILDGIVKNSGNSARGARYNSALTYIENHEDISCVAVVISEDGSIDLIPSKSMH